MPPKKGSRSVRASAEQKIKDDFKQMDAEAVSVPKGTFSTRAELDAMTTEELEKLALSFEEIHYIVWIKRRIAEVKAKGKPKSGKKGGAPTLYNSEYCKILVDYFSIPFTRSVPVKVWKKDGTLIEDSKEVPNPLPFFEEFAMFIGVNYETLLEWCKEHTEFSNAYKHSKSLQKQFLARNALNGQFNATAFIFTAKNITDMRDKVADPDEFGDKLARAIEKISDFLPDD